MSALKWLTKGFKNLGIKGIKGSGSTVPPPSTILQSRLAGTHVAETEKSIPPKPKRPLTGFFRFLNEVRPEVSKSNPNMKLTELSKAIGEKWDSLDPTTKDKYNQDFKNELDKYNQALEKYNKSLTPAQRETQEQEKLSKQLKQEKNQKKRRLVELGKPRKPPTPFFLFIKTQAPSGSSVKDNLELTKNCAARWSKMSEAEKEPFTSQYQKLSEDYQKSLDKWETDMVKLGNEDLVRATTLKAIKGEGK